MSGKLNVGVIGLGRLGKMYAKYFCGRIANANLTAIADVSDAALMSVGDLGVSKQFLNYEDLIADEAVDAVVIVSPTSTHKEVVLEAAQRGKPIFCEKPLSISLPDALAMLRTVEQTGVYFQMGFMRRFDKGYVAGKSTRRHRFEIRHNGQPDICSQKPEGRVESLFSTWPFTFFMKLSANLSSKVSAKCL